MKNFLFLIASLCITCQVLGQGNNIPESRVALVIGNADYDGYAKLKNPKNDAQRMRKVLSEELGFKVIYADNADRDEMLNKLDEFIKELPKHNVALFYYSGHGIQIKDANYLIPLKLSMEGIDERKAENYCFKVSTVADAMAEQPNNLNIIILDACRNNPMEEKGAKGIRTTQGLAMMAAQKGSIVIYATEAGKTASEGEGKTSVFTDALIANMTEPDLEIGECFRRVGKKVQIDTEGKQFPQLSLQYYGNFYFKKKDAEMLRKEAEKKRADSLAFAQKIEDDVKNKNSAEIKRVQEELAEKERIHREQEQAQKAMMANEQQERLKMEEEFKRKQEALNAERKKLEEDLRKTQAERNQLQEKVAKRKKDKKKDAKSEEEIKLEEERIKALNEVTAQLKASLLRDSISRVKAEEDRMAQEELINSKQAQLDRERKALIAQQEEIKKQAELFKSIMAQASEESSKNSTSNTKGVPKISKAKKDSLDMIQLSLANEQSWAERGVYYETKQINDKNYKYKVERIEPNIYELVIEVVTQNHGSDTHSYDLAYSSRINVLEETDKSIKTRLLYSIRRNEYDWRPSPMSYLEASFDLGVSEATFRSVEKMTTAKNMNGYMEKETFTQGVSTVRVALSTTIQHFIKYYSSAMMR